MSDFLDRDNNNILLLSAGRRVSLLRGFTDAAALRSQSGNPLKVITADSAPDKSAACQFSGAGYKLPENSSDGFIPALLKLCEDQQIGVVIPTLDTDLPMLAASRDRFLDVGIELVISDKELIDSCSDKRLTSRLFKDHGLCVPEIYELDSLVFPVFVKPYDGSRSQGIRILHRPDQLVDDVIDNQKNIYCEYINHLTHTEFTCDLYFDKSGQLCCVVPRERLEVRSGEVSKGITRRNNIINTIFEKLSYIKGARGCITIQVFRNNDTGELKFIEINARFGGGYPLARAAGADFQSWLLDEYLYKRAPAVFDGWRADFMMLRYDDEVFVDVS